MTEKRITVSILYRTICLTDRNRDSFTLKLKSEHLLPVSSPRLFLFFLYSILLCNSNPSFNNVALEYIFLNSLSSSEYFISSERTINGLNAELYTGILCMNILSDAAIAFR